MGKFLIAHWDVVSLLGFQALTAFFVTMPDELPGSVRDLYHWFFDAVHQFANLRNMRFPTMPVLKSSDPDNAKQ